MSHLKKGGAILVDSSLKGCAAIVTMLQERTSTIRLLTINSAKGFIFTFDVPSNSLFRNFRFLGGGLIESFIIKLTVIDAMGNSRLPICENKQKRTESAQTFYDEAKIQNQIWIDSAVGSRNIFTPSVANFSLFHKEQAYKFLGNMMKPPFDHETIRVIEYLQKLFKPGVSWSCDLGLILMPNIVNSIGLSKYLSQPGADVHAAYCKSIANAINLFLFKKVFHFDLHGENAMIQTTAAGDINSFIIDFGRAMDISKDAMPGSSYLQTDDELNQVREISRELANNFIASKLSDDAVKANVILETMKSLKAIDNHQHTKIYPNYNRFRYQMGWMNPVIEEPDFPAQQKLLLCIYNKVADDYYIDLTTSTPPLQKSTIAGYIRENKLIDFTQGIDTFYCTDPRMSPSPPPVSTFIPPPASTASTSATFVPPPASTSATASPASPSAKRQRTFLGGRKSFYRSARCPGRRSFYRSARCPGRKSFATRKKMRKPKLKKNTKRMGKRY